MTTPDPSADPNFDGLFNYADLAGAVAAVPELRTQPSLATSVAQSGPGAVGTAQALVGTVNQANASQVVQRAQHDGLLGHLAHAIGAIRDGIERVPLLGSAVHAAGNAAGTVLGWANAPLGDVQHNYRFVRDVFDAHGVTAGVGELLAASVGGIAGGVAGFAGGAAAGAATGFGFGAIPGAIGGAFAGAKIGSEGALTLAAKYGPYQDSWARTQNGDSYQLHGHTVSLGRDVASAIGLPQGVNHTLASITDSIPIIGTVLHGLGVSGDPYRAVSGAVDGAADVGADPLLAASSLSKLNRARTIITSPKDFEALALNPPARFTRMVNDVAGSNEGQIIEHYPTLAPYAPQLAKASTPVEVIDVLRTNLNAADGLIGTRTIPSYTITRVPFRKIADSLRDAAPQETTGLSPAEMAAILPTQGLRLLTAKITNSLSNRTPFALDPDTKELLSTGWDVNNPRANEVLFSTAKLHQSLDYARAMVARFGSTDDPAAKYQIWDQVHADTAAAALAKHGITDPKVVERFTSELRDQSAAAGGGRDGQYSMKIQPNPTTGDLEWVSNDRIPVGAGATAPSATWEPQAGKLYTYNWSTLNSAARRMGKVSKYYGAVDDGMYKYFMAPVFKPGNLLTMGFALRNAGNELMTFAIKNGGLNLVRSFVAKTGAKLDYKYLGASPTVPDEIDHVTAALAESVGPAQALKDAKSSADVTRTGVATRLLADNGAILPGALDAAHHSQEFGGDNLSGLKDQASKVIASVTGRGGGERFGPNFVQYTNGDGHKYAHALSGALAMAVRDPAAPVVAQAYRDALDAPILEREAVPGVVGRPAVPADVATPAAPNLPPLFHGTSKAFEGDKLGQKYENGASADNLLGPGFYATDKPEVAAKYTAKGRKALGEGAQPTVYSVKHTGTPRMLDMEQPLPAPVLAEFKKAAGGDGFGPADYISPEEFDGLTGVQAYAKLRDALSEWSVDDRIPKHEIDEILHDLNDGIASHGYDGMTHLGGQHFGKGVDHNVHIFFDNSKVSVQRHELGSAEVQGIPGFPAVYRTPEGPVTWQSTARTRAVAAAQKAGLDWLQSDKGAFQRSLLKGAQTAAVGHDGMDPLLSFATRRAESVEALTYGENGVLNRDLLDGIADHNTQISGRTAGGLHPNLHPDVLNAQDPNSLPARVPGMEIIPTQEIGLQRLVNKGFSVLGGIINRLSRDPMYVNHVFEEYKLTSATPGLSDDEAWHLAQTRAIERMVPEIHNPQDRSQFALAARNYIPFLFAREQAYKRLGQALATNPAGFRGPQLIGHALKSIGWVSTQTGPDGKPQDTFNYPLSGPIGNGVNDMLHKMGVPTAVGIPTGFRGSITGLAAGGETPGSLTGIGWSPILSIPVRALASLDPGAQQFVESVEGPAAAGQSNLAEAIPNAPLRSFLIGAYPGLAKRTFTNAMIDSIQYAVANGDIPPNPYKADGKTPDPAYTHWMDKFTTRNRILFGVKALFGVGAPASPTMQQGSDLLRPLAKQYIDKYGKSEGMQRLFQDHPNITSYEVFRSAPNSALPDSQKALNWASNNREFINTYGRAATFFAPQPASGSANDAAVRNAEFGLGLRERRTPDEFVQEVVAQTGWNLYEQAKAARDAAIAAHPGDDQYAADQARNFNGYVQNTLGRLNPTWYSQYTNLDANLQQQRNLVEQTRAILNKGLYPPGSEGSAAILRSLMGSYDAHMQALALTGGNSSLYTTKAARDERTNYQAFLTGFAKQYPEASIIISRLFKGA